MNEIEQAIEWLEEHLPPLEDYGNMIGAPAQYCGIKYVYNDPCGYVFETAIEALKEKLEREKGCAEDFPNSEHDGEDAVICHIQNCDMELAFAMAQVEVKEWLLDNNDGY